MKSQLHIQKKAPYQSSHIPITNPFSPRPFGIQAQTEQPSSVKENVDLEAQSEHPKRSGYNLTNLPVNAPGTAPPPPIQTKLTIGQPGDRYEQEADRVAAQVVSQINSPASGQSGQGSTVQRAEVTEEELAQAKPVADTIQRAEVPEEELAQTKPVAGTIQRVEVPEEELAQAKSMVQRQTQEGNAATPDLETSIQQARGSGQPLPENIQAPMEQAFGANFSAVRVHTDAQSHQLNQSIQARAFTTGQDIFFRQGEYNPGSSGGQELLAHELTHVVQQGGAKR